MKTYFEKGQVRISYTQDVTYELEGQKRMVPLTDGKGEDCHVMAVCTQYQSGQDYQIIGVKAYNVGREPIVLKELIYLRIREWEDFQIGDGDYASYRVFRQGRHKNDLPSVFTLGIKDDCFADAAGGMLETGEQKMGEMASVISSDSLTMFHHQGETVQLGFLTGRNSFVECRINPAGGDALACGCVSVNVTLAPGEVFEGERLLIRTGQDEQKLIEEFAVEKRELLGAKKRKKMPAVFCTWYYYGLTVTYQDVISNLREIEKRKLPFDVYQVDEGWEITLGEWSPNKKFPKSMKTVADEIRAAGLTAGIWTSPFIAHATASVWKEHPEWMLRDKNGNAYDFPMNDTVYKVFDITNPATWEYFTRLYHRLTFDWGYTYHKLDFTRAAVIYEDGDFYDKTITLPQAYYRAVAAIRKGMGEDSFFLMCGGLYDPIIGLVDGQRMGSDVLSMWVSDVNRDGKAQPFTIKQNLLRFYMNEWWGNDPDALMVRRRTEMDRGLRLTLGLLSDEEVKTTTVNQYVGGGLMCSTEPLMEIDEERLSQLKHVLPIVDTKTRVRDLFHCGRFPEEVLVDVTEHSWRNLVQFNWQDQQEKPAGFTVPGEKDYAGEYLVAEFYSGQVFRHKKAGDRVDAGLIPPHGCAVFKIERENNQIPHIIGSDGHYSMGGEIRTLKAEDGDLVLEMSALFDWPTTYRVLVPGGITGGEDLELDFEISGRGEKQMRFPLPGSKRKTE